MKMPLRTVLKNFLNHVEDLEAREKISDDQYETEFQELKKLTDKLKEDPEYSSACGLKDVNRPKNRYKDIVPYDTSRVVLPKYDGVPGSDYINASHVKGSTGAFAYIAAQGPLPNTVIDFWRMIWICDVQVIVMACNVQEAGKYKCESYWPIKGETNHFGNISVELISTNQVCPDFLVRTLLVKCGTEMRDVYQFHYTTWPDHGVPETVQPILELVRLMRDCQASETVPILVHCSAGCGRTGTICAVDFVWACLRHGKLDKDFSLFQIALELRRQRIAMIQTKEQYILAHKAVAVMFEQQLKVIDYHIYENIDEDGEPLMWKELQENEKSSIQIKKADEGKTDNHSNRSSLLPQHNDKENKTEVSSNRESKCSEKSIVTSTSMLNTTSESSTTLSSSFHNNETHFRNSIASSKNSEGSFSRNSYLSQQSNNDDAIPFIDEEEEINVRPQCGRAYLNIPSCDSITKLINAFDPFVDKLSLCTDDSSPEAEGLPVIVNNKSKSDNGDVSNGTLLPGSYKQIDPDSALTSEIKDKPVPDAKKIGKTTVVRRPSISKLKALFERPSSSGERSSINEGKRSLFRNNSHHVSRAGSAPPSLNCMDKNAATEKESVLMMVTRKFRSSSVKSEQELNAKKNGNPQGRKTPMSSFKESLNSLSRTMSLNLNKSFKLYNPASSTKPPEDGEKPPTHPSGCATYSKPKESASIGSRFKLPDLVPKGKSMWYDKSSLPRAVGVVKPSESKLKESSGKNVSVFNVIDRPPKLLPFLTSLSRSEIKEPSTSTMWYENNIASWKDSATTLEKCKDVSPTTKSFSLSKVLASGQTNPTLKKDTPDIHPVSKNDSDESTLQTCNSKFYTHVDSRSSLPPSLPMKRRIPSETLPCPVPEEIIPISSVLLKSNEGDSNAFWPSSPVVSPEGNAVETAEAGNSLEKDCNANGGKVLQSSDLLEDGKKNKDEEDASKMVFVHPPAIPKKVGKGKGSDSEFPVMDEKPKVNASEPAIEMLDANKNSVQELDSKPGEKKASVVGNVGSPQQPSNDLYSNINETAQKNILQIENTLRNNPRGAIIDLTSRQSYSMEEELVSAVEQLTSETPVSKPMKPSGGKFPGYEVIWPESIGDDLKTTDAGLSKQIKTGLCYSPPLRRNVNSGFSVTKSQSCVNLDWMDLGQDSSLSESSFEKGSEPTKKLVTEAVVELNTLLNQLTTRTLAEDSGTESTSDSSKTENGLKSENLVESGKNAALSVPLSTKAYISVATSKDEEIIFHFPPPPRVPPPPRDEVASESFEIICKNGALSVANAEKKDGFGDAKTDILQNGPVQKSIGCQSPKPLPRKTKPTLGIQRSISYTSIHQSEAKNVAYENVFPEKYQTLSQLEVNNNKLGCEGKSLHIDSPLKNNKDNSVEYKAKYSTPKEKPSKSIQAENPRYANINANVFPTVGYKSLIDNNNSNILKTDALESSKQEINTSVKSGKQPSNLCTETDVNKIKGHLDIARKSDSTFIDKEVLSSSNSNYTPEEKTPPKRFMVCNDTSNYGKIIRIPEAVASTNSAKDQLLAETGHSPNIGGTRKKPLPSKKSERAPLPPCIKTTMDADEGGYGKLEKIRKSPSRKQEKAPPPPLQKISPLKNGSPSKFDQNQYANISASIANSKKLPALYENISDVQNSAKPTASTEEPPSQPATATPFYLQHSQFDNKNNPFSSEHSQSDVKTGPFGLQHSQSDASVFRSIKDRKLQYQGIPVKTFVKPLPSNKKTVETTRGEHVSNSVNDSDHSYEHIFPSKLPRNELINVTKQENGLKSNSSNLSASYAKATMSAVPLLKDSSERVAPSMNFSPVQQPSSHLSKDNFKKSTPTAPPRSRRRSTTEISYAKVKSKGGSLTPSAAATFQKFSAENETTPSPSNGDLPPTIPTKTKDALEFPEGFNRGHRQKPSHVQNADISCQATKSHQNFEVS